MKARTVCGAVCFAGLVCTALILYKNDKFDAKDYFPGCAGAGKGISRSSQYLKLEARLNGPLLPRDVFLVDTVRTDYLNPPSRNTYHLASDVDDTYNKQMSTFPSWVMINSIVQDMFSQEPPGFFVEAGALDGEFISNTLWLEQTMGWRGLLVEPDARNFRSIQSKQRKAWVAPACLSRFGYPYKEIFTLKSAAEDNVNQILRGSTAAKNNLEEATTSYETFQSAQCLPVETLLAALNVNHVDFFSLDTEGGEMDVLRHFPFHEITVDVWVVEHIAKKKWTKLGKKANYEDQNISLNQMTKSNFSSDLIADRISILSAIEDLDLISFMLDKGYYLFDVLCYRIPDLFFVRIRSKLFQRLSVPEAAVQRTSVCDNKPLHNSGGNMPPLAHFRDAHHYPHIGYKEIAH